MASDKVQQVNDTEFDTLISADQPTVITSYSIHYTKLYEVIPRNCNSNPWGTKRVITRVTTITITNTSRKLAARLTG